MINLRNKILEILGNYPGETFVSLMQHMGDTEDLKGDQKIIFDEYNILIWAGMSKEFSNTMLDLYKEKKIEYNPTYWLTYLVDGGLLNYPLAKKATKYKNPHWIPTVIYLYGTKPKL